MYLWSVQLKAIIFHQFNKKTKHSRTLPTLNDSLQFRSNSHYFHMSREKIVNQTKNWLTSFIIPYNICPFARQVYEQGVIHYSVIESKKIDQCLEAVFTEYLRLDTQHEIETTLIIFPHQFPLFIDYLDFLDLAESLLRDQNYEGVYQLASFHPYYCLNRY